MTMTVLSIEVKIHPTEKSPKKSLFITGFCFRMNGLKEVSRLIEETESSRSKQGISQDEVMDWMSSNKVLSVVLEGNIDQVQYTDRIKAIVEFLGPKLSPEELTNIWNLGEVNRSEKIFRADC